MLPYPERIRRLVAGFDAATTAALAHIATPKHFAKGSYLLRAGEPCRQSYHLRSGIARQFYWDAGGRPITTAFYLAGDIAVDVSSYATQSPSRTWIACLSAVEADVTEHAAFEQAKREHPKLVELDLLLTEWHAVALEARLFERQTCSAAQRYERLLAEAPDLLQHVSLGHIASYLGISPETLSRIRRARR